MLETRVILADPDERLLLRHARGEERGKADRSRGVARLRNDFVLRAAQQAAAKTMVGLFMAERRAAPRVLLREGQDRAPQGSDGMGTLNVHVMF